MIDDKLLATYENRVAAAMQESEDPLPSQQMTSELIEIIRNARRYLALRELFKTEWLCNYLDYGPGKELESSSARLQLDIPSTTAAMGSPPTSLVDGNVIDEAADRLLEGENER